MLVESLSLIIFLDVSLFKYMMMVCKELLCVVIIMFFLDFSFGIICLYSIIYWWGLGNCVISLIKVMLGECLEVKGSC